MDCGFLFCFGFLTISFLGGLYISSCRRWLTGHGPNRRFQMVSERALFREKKRNSLNLHNSTNESWTCARHDRDGLQAWGWGPWRGGGRPTHQSLLTPLSSASPLRGQKGVPVYSVKRSNPPSRVQVPVEIEGIFHRDFKEH